MRVILPLVTAVLSGAFVAAAQNNTAGELKALQGTWLIVSGVYNGEDHTSGGKFIVRGDRYQILAKDGSDGSMLGSEGRLTVVPGKNPNQINFYYKDLLTDYTDLGIYELKGESLRICSNANDRATKYESTPDSYNNLLVLKRTK